MVDTADTTDLRECPLCHELIKKKANKCKHCKQALPPIEDDAQPSGTAPATVSNPVDGVAPKKIGANLANDIKSDSGAIAPNGSTANASPAQANAFSGVQSVRSATPVANAPLPATRSIETKPKHRIVAVCVGLLCGIYALSWFLGYIKQHQIGLTANASNIYAVPQGGFLYRTWQACDAMERNDLARFDEVGGADQAVACLCNGGKVEVLETMGGDISYVRVRVIAGRQMSDPSVSLEGTEGWMSKKKLTQAPQPVDQFKSRFDSLAKGIDGISMENPSNDSDGYYGNLADGVYMTGCKVTDKGTISSVDLRMSREYHGDESVISTRQKHWAEAAFCLVRTVDSTLSEDSANALLAQLGISRSGQGIDIAKLNAHAQNGDFNYASDAESNSFIFSIKRKEPQTLDSSQSSPGAAPPASDQARIPIEQSSPVIVANSQQASREPSDATGMISQMLQAQKQGDEGLLNRAQADLAALPKPSPGDSTEATRLNKLGLKGLKSKNYSEAVTLFSAASKADPSDPKLFSNLGYAETFAGDLPSAEKHLIASIALDPSRAVAWGDLGLLYAKQGKQEDAVASFLIGYKVSRDMPGFLKFLQTNEDPAVRDASAAALAKLPATNPGTPGNAPDPSDVPQTRPQSPNGGNSLDTSRL